MAYLKPFNPAWGRRNGVYWICEVFHSGEFSYSYPIFKPNPYYNDIIYKSRRKYNAELWTRLRVLLGYHIYRYYTFVALNPQTSYGIAHKCYYLNYYHHKAVIIVNILGKLEEYL